MVRVLPRSLLPSSGEEEGLSIISRLPVVCRQSYKGEPFGIFRGENPLKYAFSSFLLDAIIIIFFIKLFCFLLRPLRQPRIICEILGGMVVGPSLLGQNRKFNYYVFPHVADYLISNFGIIGFMYFLFITGVKTDVLAVAKSPRKHMYIAAIGVFVPLVSVGIVALSLRHRMDHGMKKMSAMGAVATSLAFTSFPVIYTVLQGANLLNSEVGKFAMSVALLGDMVGILVLIVFEAMTQGEVAGVMAVVWYMMSVFVLGAFMGTVVKRSLQWVINKTPDGKSVHQSYIVIILLGVLFSGFLTDMFGMSVAVGPMWLGLLIPDGPPLGATLVAKSETIITEILMPFSFAVVGLHTNVYLLSSETWPSELAPLFAMSIVGYLSKFLTTTAAALLFKVPTRESLTLGLIMNLRGQIEVLLYLHWINKGIIATPGFSMLVVQTIVVTSLSSPVITLLYDPTRLYKSSIPRTIQHTPPSTDPGLVLAVSDHETLSGLVSLLDFTYPTTDSQFVIFAIQLVELVGRATPVFIDHQEREKSEDEAKEERLSGGRDDPIQIALRLYQENREECVRLHAYTAQAPKNLMYQDICELALTKQTAFILLPYQKERLGHAAPTELRDRGMLAVNNDVLAHAPCSVCIYYDKGRLKKNPNISFQGNCRQTYNFVVLFMGGADNREALHLADRMTENPDIILTVVRFMSFNHDGEDERERKLDDGVVTWFWMKNESNDRVMYKEVVVKNGAETLAAIQAMNVNDYDLWLTGRREGINPMLVEGLSTWSEDHQLGVVGDTVASSEFASGGSVLVVQQQVKNHNAGVGFSKAIFNCKNLFALFSP